MQRLSKKEKKALGLLNENVDKNEYNDKKKKKIKPKDFIKSNMLSKLPRCADFAKKFTDEAEEYILAIDMVDFLISSLKDPKYAESLKSKETILAALDENIKGAVKQVLSGLSFGGEQEKRMEQFLQLRILLEKTLFEHLTKDNIFMPAMNLGNRKELKDYIENIADDEEKNKMLKKLMLVKEELQATQKNLLNVAHTLTSSVVTDLLSMESAFEKKKSVGHDQIRTELKNEDQLCKFAQRELQYQKAKPKVEDQIRRKFEEKEFENEDLKEAAIKKEVLDYALLNEPLSQEERNNIRNEISSQVLAEKNQKINNLETEILTKIADNLSIFEKMKIKSFMASEILEIAESLDYRSKDRKPFLEICEAFPTTCFPQKEIKRQKDEEQRIEKELEELKKVAAANNKKNKNIIKNKKRNARRKTRSSELARKSSNFRKNRSVMKPTIVPALNMPAPFFEEHRDNFVFRDGNESKENDSQDEQIIKQLNKDLFLIGAFNEEARVREEKNVNPEQYVGLLNTEPYPVRKLKSDIYPANLHVKKKKKTPLSATRSLTPKEGLKRSLRLSRAETPLTLTAPIPLPPLPTEEKELTRGRRLSPNFQKKIKLNLPLQNEDLSKSKSSTNSSKSSSAQNSGSSRSHSLLTKREIKSALKKNSPSPKKLTSNSATGDSQKGQNCSPNRKGPLEKRKNLNKESVKELVIVGSPPGSPGSLSITLSTTSESNSLNPIGKRLIDRSDRRKTTFSGSGNRNTFFFNAEAAQPPEKEEKGAHHKTKDKTKARKSINYS